MLVITDPGMPPTVFVVPDEALNQDDIKRLNRLLEYIGSYDFDAEDFRECKNLKEVHEAISMDQGLEDDDEAPDFDWHPDQKLAVTRSGVKRQHLNMFGTTTGRLSSNHPGLANTPKSDRQAAKIQDFGHALAKAGQHLKHESTLVTKIEPISPTGRTPSEPELQHINPSLQGKKYERPRILAEFDYAAIEKRVLAAIGQPVMQIYDEYLMEIPEKDAPHARALLNVLFERALPKMKFPIGQIGDYRIYGTDFGRWSSKESNLQELPKKLKTPKGTEIERTWEPCSDGCLGWVHMNEPYEVEACDECGRFKALPVVRKPPDEQAAEAHREECGCGWPEIDYQDAAMAWVNDIDEDNLVNNLTQSDLSELEGLLNCRGVEFMDNVTPAIYVCSRLIEKTKEGPDHHRLQNLMKLLKKVQDGISNETLKLKDFGDPPGAEEENH